MHRKIGKDRECGFGDILADRQTNTQTDVLITNSQYFATAQAGEVIIAAQTAFYHCTFFLSHYTPKFRFNRKL